MLHQHFGYLKVLYKRSKRYGYDISPTWPKCDTDEISFYLCRFAIHKPASKRNEIRVFHQYRISAIYGICTPKSSGDRSEGFEIRLKGLMFRGNLHECRGK